MKFRKKPVAIEAMQFTRQSYREIEKWSNGEVWSNPVLAGQPSPLFMQIATLEGTMTATLGDWIIKGVQGEFYPCKPDIFEATYEAAGREGE